MEYNGEWVHGDRDGNGVFTQYLNSEKTMVLSYSGIWRKNKVRISPIPSHVPSSYLFFLFPPSTRGTNRKPKEEY